MRRFSLIPAVALLGALFMVLRPSTAGTTVRIANFSYRPAAVRIQPGGAVTFTNTSRTTHTVTCVGCPIDAGDVQPGLHKTITFPNSGSYAFACRYHQSAGMRMTVTVGSASPATPSPSPAAS